MKGAGHRVAFFLVFVAASVLAWPLRAQNFAEASLDNGVIKIGVNTNNYGGSITYLSLSGSTNNLINNYDLGRQVQQSYFAGPTNFLPAGATMHPSWTPWPWNPIQTGDVYNKRSQVLAASNSDGVLYIKTRPMQWALSNVPGDCFFEWWIRLEGPAARVRCRLSNQRTDPAQYPERDQEMPAVYGVGTLTNLVSYTGTAPFTGGATSKLPLVGPPWTYWRATENWSAMVNSTNFGIGVHQPETVYTVGGYSKNASPIGTGGPTNFNTAYISPVQTEVLDANIVFEYEFNLIVGTLTEIRNWVYALNPDPRPSWRFTNNRAHWFSRPGDAGPPAGYLRQKLNSDPNLYSPYCAFPATNVPQLHFAARFNVSQWPASPLAQLFWETNNVSGLTEANSRTVALQPTNNVWRIYSIPLSNHTGWSGLISRVRLDVIQSAATNDTADIAGLVWTNAPPVTSGLTNLVLPVSSAPATVNFTVADDLMPAEGLTVTAVSSDTMLLPSSGITVSGSGANRTLVLSPAAGRSGSATVSVTVSDTATNATTSFLLSVPTPVIDVSGTLSPFVTTVGGPSAAQSFTAGGSNLVGDVTVTAPSGFEVSTNNSVFEPSFSVAPVAGSVSVMTIYTRLGGWAAGTFSGNVTLSSTCATMQTRAVSGTVRTLYQSWLQGAAHGASSQLAYAIGGAPGASSQGVPAATAVNSGQMSITAIVRTNDTNLSVFGQSVTSLTSGNWSSNEVTRTVPSDQSGAVPGTTQRQIFSTPLGSETEKFLRLRTILGGQTP